MQKIIKTSALLVGIIFLAGCGQSPVSQVQPMTQVPVAQKPVAGTTPAGEYQTQQPAASQGSIIFVEPDNATCEKYKKILSAYGEIVMPKTKFPATVPALDGAEGVVELRNLIDISEYESNYQGNLCSFSIIYFKTKTADQFQTVVYNKIKKSFYDDGYVDFGDLDAAGFGGHWRDSFMKKPQQIILLDSGFEPLIKCTDKGFSAQECYDRNELVAYGSFSAGVKK